MTTSTPYMTPLWQGVAKADRVNTGTPSLTFDQAIRLQPNYVDAYYNRGVARFHLGQYQVAIADFDTALRMQPDYAGAYVMRGVAKASMGKQHECHHRL